MTKIINEKAENSLKFVTQQLKEQLLKDFGKYFPKEEKKLKMLLMILRIILILIINVYQLN